jgi:hypothetical protein
MASFSGDGIINIRNQHQWAEENPHGVTTKVQRGFRFVIGFIELLQICD